MLVLLFALVASAYSAELICAPYFESIGLNADFGKSSVEVLQGKMQKLAYNRQLVIPSADYIVAGDNINKQITWAKSSGCLYLLQTTLTQLEKNIQANARVMNLKTGDYVFENTYKANSADDLPLIFERLGNTLQHPEFAEAETKADIEDFKDLTKRNSMKQFGVSYGFFNFNNQNYIDGSLRYLWDIRTLWIEAILSFRMNFSDYGLTSSFGPGISILYPFSSKPNTFYIGSGGGFLMEEKSSDDYYYGMFIENSLGYLVWLNNKLPTRIEAAAGAIFNDGKSMGGGLRIIMSFPAAKEKSDTLNSQIKQAMHTEEPVKKSIEAEPIKDSSQKKTKLMSRFAYNSYYVSGGPQGHESGSGIKGGIAASIPIGNNDAFEPGISLFIRTLTLNNVIHYDYGYNYYNDFKLEEIGISIPALVKIMPFGGPKFYIEGGIQFDFFGTDDKDHVGYDSRAAFDLGLASGMGWNIGEKFSFGFRSIIGLTNFDNAGRSKPSQIELSVSRKIF